MKKDQVTIFRITGDKALSNARLRNINILLEGMALGETCPLYPNEES